MPFDPTPAVQQRPKRLKGKALRIYVRKAQALAFFPRWRAKVDATAALMASRTSFQNAYFTQRAQGKKAIRAIEAARDHLQRLDEESRGYFRSYDRHARVEESA